MLSVGTLPGLILGLLMQSRSLVPAGGWESHGPPFPFASGIAVSAEDAAVAYATASNYFLGADGRWSSESAVFRSMDGGLTWATLASTPSGEVATEVAIDPFVPSRLLATTAGAFTVGSRVYLTQDGGATWYGVADFPSCNGPSITYDRTLPNRAYAVCDQLLRSDDGLTWTALNVSIVVPGFSFYPVLKTGADGAVYAILTDRILRSSNHGDSWTEIVKAPSSCPSITAFAVDPEDPSVLYVGTGRGSAAGRFDCGGLYKSMDGGRTLSRTLLPDQFVTDVTVDSTDPSIVYTGSTNVGFFSAVGRVSQSLDAGQSWYDFGLIGPISHLVLSASGRLLYASIDSAGGGVFRRPVRKTRTRLVPTRPADRLECWPIAGP